MCKCVCAHQNMCSIFYNPSTQWIQDQPGDCAFRYQGSLCALVNVYVCQHLHVHVFVQVTLKLLDQMCRSLYCGECWVAPSLTLQTWNNAHRSLHLMSSLYREHIERASTLPTVSIRASISGEQSFLCLCWHWTKELDTKCKSALSTWGGFSLFVSQGGEWQVHT